MVVGISFFPFVTGACYVHYELVATIVKEALIYVVALLVALCPRKGAVMTYQFHFLLLAISFGTAMFGAVFCGLIGCPAAIPCFADEA